MEFSTAVDWRVLFYCQSAAAVSKAMQQHQQLMVACSGSASEHTASSPSAATDDVYQTLSLADTASPQQVSMSLKIPVFTLSPFL